MQITEVQGHNHILEIKLNRNITWQRKGATWRSRDAKEDYIREDGCLPLASLWLLMGLLAFILWMSAGSNFLLEGEPEAGGSLLWFQVWQKPEGGRQLLTAVIEGALGYSGLGRELQMISNSDEIMEGHSPAQWHLLSMWPSSHQA